MEALRQPMHIAVPTVFDQQEALDVDTTIAHILYLQSQEVRSVLVCGSTGEQHSLTLAEKQQLLEGLASESGFAPDFEIIFGVASIRQTEAVQLARDIEQNKAINAVLLGFPPYILPSQSEMRRYVQAVIEPLSKPVILYNNPRRTGFDLSLELVNELLLNDQIIGMKEAGDYQRVRDFIWPKGKRKYLYAGGEGQLAEKVLLGFNRLSSIGGNIYPREIQQWFQQLLSDATVPFPQQQALDTILTTTPLVQLKQTIAQKEGLAMGKPRAPLGN